MRQIQTVKSLSENRSESRCTAGGCCISEICAKAVLELAKDKQNAIFDELFGKEHCGFDYCRLSIGANDFAESWYSYDETEGDYAMEHFSIDRDRKYILPAIREAQKRSSELHFSLLPGVRLPG